MPSAICEHRSVTTKPRGARCDLHQRVNVWSVSASRLSRGSRKDMVRVTRRCPLALTTRSLLSSGVAVVCFPFPPFCCAGFFELLMKAVESWASLYRYSSLW